MYTTHRTHLLLMNPTTGFNHLCEDRRCCGQTKWEACELVSLAPPAEMQVLVKYASFKSILTMYSPLLKWSNVSWCFFIMYYDICVSLFIIRYFTVSVLNPMYHQSTTLYHSFISDLALYSSMILLPCCLPTLHITCTYLSLPHLYHVL